ncbi:unnamed protein product [Eretmochelys imbricata]
MERQPQAGYRGEFTPEMGQQQPPTSPALLCTLLKPWRSAQVVAMSTNTPTAPKSEKKSGSELIWCPMTIQNFTFDFMHWPPIPGSLRELSWVLCFQPLVGR